MTIATEAREWLAHALADDELAHHGVLGMKWGVRHDDPLVGRKKGSSPDPAPRTRVAQPIAQRSAIDPAGNVKKRVIKEEPPKKVHLINTKKDTHMKAGEVLAVAGASVAVAGYAATTPITREAAGYLGSPLFKKTLDKDVADILKNTAGIDRAKDFLNDKVDTTVPANTVFHRVASYKETEINGPKYATYLEDDVLRYRNSWITPGRTRLNGHFVTKMQATSDIKIASPDSIRSVLEKELLSKGPNGKSLADMYFAQPNYKFYTPEHIALLKSEPKSLVDDIIFHNRTNVWADDIGDATSYWMKKAGYAAVTDINNTGSDARKHAVIVLDKAAFNVSSRRLTEFERSAAKIAQNNISKTAAKTAATGIVQSKVARTAAKEAIKLAVTRKL